MPPSPQVRGFIRTILVTVIGAGSLMAALLSELIFQDGFENHPPNIVSTPVVEARISVPYRYDVDASDIDGDVLLYGLVVAPAGMSIDEFSGEIGWTPAAAGIFDVEVLVSDGNGGMASQSWQIEVTEIVDSDGDGLSDDEEVLYGTDPNDPDCDDDDLLDGEEVFTYGTDPLDFDSDDDQFGDGAEVARGSDPLNDGDFPRLNAPAIDPTVVTTIHDSTAFLYSGDDPIQIGVADGTIDPVRAAVVRGKVFDDEGVPLSGVSITVLDHPELGQALTLPDGVFNMVINGGGVSVLNYAKPGFLPVQRQVDVPWQDYIRAPDVALIPLDPIVTSVAMGSAVMQVHQGTVIMDADGTRQATLLFQPGTTAELVLPDGGTQPVSSLEIRATEYTVGANGPERMPAELPANSGYTYAVEISADEALAMGATDLQLDQPVYYYVEDFIGFPVGSSVPTGYYDRDTAQWIASKNGRVIKILTVAGQLAELDTDGDELADDASTLAALNITAAEQQSLAELYGPGQVLWRVPMTHFTPWDCNWPYAPPNDAVAPPDPGSDEMVQEVGDPCEVEGSIIGCRDQTLGEQISLVGTPYSLNYRSTRARGHMASYTRKIRLSDSTVPASLKGIRLELFIAGQVYRYDFAPLPDQTFIFVWDGYDIYGRLLQGEQRLTVKVGYRYDAVYTEPAELDLAFAQFSGSGLGATDNRARQEIVLWRKWESMIGHFNIADLNLGGWTLDVHHTYDPLARRLNLGDGSARSAETVNSIIETVAGTGYQGYGGDGGPAAQALINQPISVEVGPDGSFYFSGSDYRVRHVDPAGIITTVAGNGAYCAPATDPCGDGGPATAARTYGGDLALGADGSIYIAEYKSHRVRRVGPDGIITTIAGTGVAGFNGDGGPALLAQIRPRGIAVDADGSLYIADYDNDRIRKIGPDGIINTVAGTGGSGFSGDGGMATDAEVGYPWAVDVGRDGSIFVTGSHRIRRASPDGVIATVAGNGTYCAPTTDPCGDGGPATSAKISTPQAVAGGTDGSLYIVSQTAYRIRRVGRDGIITTVAGNGLNGYSGDGGPPTAARISPVDIALSHDGGFFIADRLNNRIRKVRRPLPGIEFNDIVVPSENGSQLYRFDRNGRHLSTRSTLTGAMLYTFGYDDHGHLVTLEDGSGRITTIERDPDGSPVAIAGPYGQRTDLTLDANGYLATFSNPAGEAWQFGYTDDGLMTSATDPNGNPSAYSYDADGRLILAEDAAGGSQALARTVLPDGYEVTRTTGLGRTTTYRVERLPTDDAQLTNTAGCCGQSEVVVGTDGAVTVTLPDGTILNTVQGPDPRFGMQAPIAKSSNTETPGGLTSTITREVAVTLADPNDPMSLQSQTDTITVNGRVYTRTYTAAGRELTFSSPEGRQAVYQLDSHGRILSRNVAGIEPVLVAYDDDGRLVSLTQGADAATRQYLFSYGTNGLLSTVTGPLSLTVTFERDAAGRINRLELADGREVTYGYDPKGNRTSLVPPGRPDHVFEYSAVDRETRYSPPEVGAGTNDTVVDYNGDRQVIQITRPDGGVASPSYGSSGLLETLTLPRGVVSHSYDPAGSIASITTPVGDALTFANDGYLTTEISWTGQVAGSITQSYDNDFWLTSRSVNGAHSITFTYDDDGLLTQAGALSLTRNPQNGRVTGSTLGGLTDAVGYSSFGETASYTAFYSDVEQYDVQYTRDKLGRITELTETIGGLTRSYTYLYDPTGRLKEVKEDGVTTTTYGYDDNSNRISEGGIAATYDDQDRLLTYGTTSYSHSANGEWQSKTNGAAVTTYDYDALGNLMSVSLPDATAIEYVIDGANRRIGKKINGALVQGFLYRDDLSPIAELDGAGTVVSRFVYASRPQVPDYMIRGVTTYRIVSDHLGSPRLVIDVDTGTIVQRMDYDAFGNLLTDSNPGFQPFGFAGGLYDPDTGLTRFGARDYDAATGRWTARDPIRFAGGDSNLYGYVLNDPVNWIDPTGKQCSSAVSEAYLAALTDLLALQREKSRVTQYIANRGTHIYSRRDVPSFTWDGFLGALGKAVSGGAADLYEPTGTINEQIHQDDEDTTEQTYGIIARHEARLAEIDVEILAIEQSISLALGSCPCLWSTEFP